jgi:hypothetical protein
MTSLLVGFLFSRRLLKDFHVEGPYIPRVFTQLLFMVSESFQICDQILLSQVLELYCCGMNKKVGLREKDNVPALSP